MRPGRLESRAEVSYPGLDEARVYIRGDLRAFIKVRKGLRREI